MRKYKRLTIVVFSLLVLSSPLFFPVDAGPLNSFASSPIPYWDDDSSFVDITWSSTQQTITIENTTSWLSGFSYRQLITISATTGAGTYYQVNVTVTYNAHMQADFDDIRFTDNDGSTELDYWRESYTASTTALFWVEVTDSITSGGTIFMYYGDATVTTTSDGDATFVFFDDFDDASLNTTKWDHCGDPDTHTEAGGIFTQPQDGSNWQGIASDDTWTCDDGYSIRSYISADWPGSSYGHIWGVFADDVANSDNAAYASGVHSGMSLRRDADSSKKVYDFIQASASGTATDWTGAYHTVDTIMTSTQTTIFYDGSQLNTGASPSDTVFHIQLIGNGPAVDSMADWVLLRKIVDSEPTVSFGSESSGQADLDIGVPIERKDTQTIEIYMNTTELDSEVRLELYTGTTASGTYCLVNSSYVTFPGSGITGNTYTDTSGLSRITFSVNNEQKFARITAKNENNLLLNRWTDTYITSGQNFLRILDDDFSGSITLYYLNGDTNYTNQYSSTWTMTGTPDPAVDYSKFSMLTEYENDDINHDIIYSAGLPYLNFLRTELSFMWDLTSVSDGYFMEWNMTIEIDIYSIFYCINFTYGSSPPSYINTSIIISNSTYDFYSLQMTKASSGDSYDVGIIIGKVAFWRTQENQVGVMCWGESTIDETALWTGGWGIDHTDYSAGENETIWVSDFIIDDDDWSESSVSIGYEIDGAAATDDATIELNLNYFEYSYWAPSGVVQPHFSTTWYEYHVNFERIMDGPGGYGISDDTWFYYNQTSVDSPPPPQAVDPWQSLAEWIASSLVSLIGGASQSITLGFSTLFDTVVRSVDSLANTLGISLDLLAVILGTPTNIGAAFFSAAAAIFGFIFTIVNIIVAFFNLLVALSGYIAIMLTWVQNHILTAQVGQLVVAVLILLPVMALNGSNIMNRGTGWSGAAAWIATYVSIGVSILNGAWSVITGVISIVGDIIPF